MLKHVQRLASHPPLVVLGYSEAGMFLRCAAGADVRAILSIHGYREFGAEAVVPHRLDLRFDDVDVADPADVETAYRVAARRRWAEQNGLIQVPPTREDVEQIIAFARAVRDVDGSVLVHCAGGVSRAPAAALVCLATWAGPGTEAECVRQIQSLRPAAVPHMGVVRLADALLGRGGRLSGALLR
jgi:predicted protein tyrosine phosphatase